MQKLAEVAKPAPTKAENPGGRGKKSGTDSTSIPVCGETLPYLTARIIRDRPDIAERMKAGEFPSVRQAALEAGIVEKKANLDPVKVTSFGDGTSASYLTARIVRDHPTFVGAGSAEFSRSVTRVTCYRSRGGRGSFLG